MFGADHELGHGAGDIDGEDEGSCADAGADGEETGGGDPEDFVEGDPCFGVDVEAGDASGVDFGFGFEDPDLGVSEERGDGGIDEAERFSAAGGADEESGGEFVAFEGGAGFCAEVVRGLAEGEDEADLADGDAGDVDFAGHFELAAETEEGDGSAGRAAGTEGEHALDADAGVVLLFAGALAHESDRGFAADDDFSAVAHFGGIVAVAFGARGFGVEGVDLEPAFEFEVVGGAEAETGVDAELVDAVAGDASVAFDGGSAEGFAGLAEAGGELGEAEFFVEGFEG